MFFCYHNNCLIFFHNKHFQLADRIYNSEAGSSFQKLVRPFDVENSWHIQTGTQIQLIYFRLVVQLVKIQSTNSHLWWCRVRISILLQSIKHVVYCCTVQAPTTQNINSWHQWQRVLELQTVDTNDRARTTNSWHQWQNDPNHMFST